MYASGITYTGVSSQSPASSTVLGANNGTSISLITPHFVILGQASTTPGTPGGLLYNTTVPLDGFTLNISGPLGSALAFGPNNGTSILTNTGLQNMFIKPPANTTTAGLPGQSLALMETTQNIRYTNAAGTGVVIDYGSQSQFRSIAGAIRFTGYLFQTSMTTSVANTGDCIGFEVTSTVAQAAPASGNFRGFYYHPAVISTGAGLEIAIETTSGLNLLNSVSGFTGVRQTVPTAFLHIGGSDGAAGDAPLKIDQGTLLAAPENGAFEYDGNNVLFTVTAGRKTFLLAVTAAAPTTSIGAAIVNFYGTSATNFLGDPNAWAAVMIGATNWKIPLYS